MNGRNAWYNGFPLWHRERNTEVAVTNDSGSAYPFTLKTSQRSHFPRAFPASLANLAATPAAVQCMATLGNQVTGGNLGTGLIAPSNWYGGDCSELRVLPCKQSLNTSPFRVVVITDMIGRYLWFRKTGGP